MARAIRKFSIILYVRQINPGLPWRDCMTELELDCLEVDCVENYEYLDWKNVEDKTANDV